MHTPVRTCSHSTGTLVPAIALQRRGAWPGQPVRSSGCIRGLRRDCADNAVTLHHLTATTLARVAGGAPAGCCRCDAVVDLLLLPDLYRRCAGAHTQFGLCVRLPSCTWRLGGATRLSWQPPFLLLWWLCKAGLVCGCVCARTTRRLTAQPRTGAARGGAGVSKAGSSTIVERSKHDWPVCTRPPLSWSGRDTLFLVGPALPAVRQELEQQSAV